MRTTPLARRLGAVALAATLGLGLAACGSDDSDGSSDSSSTTDDETGADASDESTDNGDEGGSLEELAAADFYPAVTGALRDAETFTFTSTSQSADQKSTMVGEARWSDDGMEMAATSTGDQDTQLVMLDKVIYLKGSNLGAGDKWLKLDLSKDSGSFMGMLAKAMDPEVMFKAMEAPKSVELIGEEDVDGVATNHYRITVDSESYIKAMGFPADMASFLPDELVTEMWVDADDLPRKFVQTIEAPGQGGGGATTSTTEGTYSDFGEDVEIEAPPESEVTESELPSFGG